MKANNEIQELESDIKGYDRMLARHNDDDNTWYAKGGALIKIAKLKNDNSYYSQALACYDKAIKLTCSENAVYLMDRSKLYVDMGETELAVADVKRAGELPRVSGVLGLYVENTIRDVAKLETVQATIARLASNGTINQELAGVLQEHAKVTENLVVTIGTHEQRLDSHDEKFARMEAMIIQLQQGKQLSEQQINGVKQETNDLKTQVIQHGGKIAEHDKIIVDSGAKDKALIKQGFETLEKQSPELYAYCKTFYWTALNLFTAYRNLDSGLIEGNIHTNNSKGEMIAAGGQKLLHYAAVVGSAAPVPFAAGVIGLLDTIIDDLYNAVKANRFENKVNIINKIIQSKCTVEDEIGITIGKAALAITDLKKQAILQPQPAPQGSKIEAGISWLQSKLTAIKDMILPCVNLHNKDSGAVKLALQDVTLVMTYLSENYETVIREKELLEKQITALFVFGSLDQLLIRAAININSYPYFPSADLNPNFPTDEKKKIDQKPSDTKMTKITEQFAYLNKTDEKKKIDSTLSDIKAVKVAEQLATFKKIEDAIGQKVLNKIHKQSADGKWSSRTHTHKCVKNYQEEKYINKLKNKTGLVAKSEEFKISVLKHICQGINSSPKTPKKIECLTHFNDENLGLMSKITTDYPALLEDSQIAKLLGDYHYI